MAISIQDSTCTTRESPGLLPKVIERVTPADLEAWVSEHREWIDAALIQHGALLFKGFAVSSADDFERVARSLCDRLIDYMYRSTPRTAVGAGVYTATEYPADRPIPMHNENAYQRAWPRKLVFCCLEPAASGGDSLLARNAGVTARLDDDIKAAFRELGVKYVRNYGHGVDLSWETTFQTTDPAEVEAYCRREGITCEWLSDRRLRTSQVCHALAEHPLTGQELWFNQAHVFHPSSLGEAAYQAMLDLFDEEDLPRNAFLGSGRAIDARTLSQIRSAFDAETVAVRMERGDLLLIDNMLVAHGRLPYTGPRRILVAMGDPVGRALPQDNRDASMD